MNIYVAAAFAEYPRARAAMAALRARGHVITHDWTALADVYPNDDAPTHLRQLHAREDLEGVRDADLVIVLTPADRSRGAGLWVEMGAALALGKPVVIAGEQRARNVFCELATQTEHDADAIYTVDDQPTMECPACERLFLDFDGFGVLCCDEVTGGCGYCAHATRRGDGAGGWVCEFCGEREPARAEAT